MATQIKGIILIEGPNASGKSTLVNWFRNEYGARTWHSTYKKSLEKKVFEYHLAIIKAAIAHSEKGLAVIDRNWLSEEIYAHFFRDGTYIPHEGRVLEKLLLKHSALNIACHLTGEQAVDQVEAHRKEYHTPEFVSLPEKVSDRYNAVFFGKTGYTRKVTYADDLILSGGVVNTRSDWLPYNIYKEGYNIGQFCERAIGLLERLRRNQPDAMLSNRVRNIAGKFGTARYLIVGEKVNHPDYSKCWPFMEHRRSSLLVTETMHEAGCDEREFLWTNAACDENHIESITSAKDVTVICLGKTAKEVVSKCADKNATCVFIDHPAYALRFNEVEKFKKDFTAALS